MGVRGLCSFFDQNPSLSKAHKLHDTKVIIDGNNILHQLYFNHKVDYVHGGDYNKFADVVKKHFKNLLDCKIQPIVLYDGCHDKSDRKLATTLERSKQRLTNAKHVAKHGNCAGRVLPILSLEVMKDVLDSIGIVQAQCDYEADDQITASANYYCCPVISQDSDFYIFDITCGFIRFDSLDSTPKEEVNNSGLHIKYMNCKIYYIDEFLSSFPGIDKRVLPLFGTLIGNDYVHISTFANFFAHIQLPKVKHKLKVNHRHRKMIGLLAWLKHHDLADAVQQVLSHLKVSKREQVHSIIQQAMSGYKVHHRATGKMFDSMENTDLVSHFGSEVPTTYYDNPLPIWFIEKSRAGDIPPQLLSVIALRRVFLPTQIEDVSLPSSFSCSSYIRQVIYGMLLSHDHQNHSTSVTDEQVQEYDHCIGQLKKYFLTPAYSLKGIGPLPDLFELGSLDPDHAKSLIVNVIGDDLEYFSLLPVSYKLLIGSIRFWLRNCTPKPTLAFLFGLIINIIYYNLVENQSFNPNLTTAALCDMDCTFLSITQSELDFFVENMKKYQQKPHHNNANPFIMGIVHSFSQLQTCIFYFLYLNNLLMKPFTKTKIHCCFNGTILYNLSKDLLSRSFPELFLLEVMGQSSTISKFFMELKCKILENIPDDCLVSVVLPSHKKKKKAKNKHSKEATEPNDLEDDVTSLCNKFKLLSSVTQVDDVL